MGEEIISQLLAQRNVDSFAVIHNDGSAHFRGSAPDSTFNLSAIEPYEGEYPNNESYDDCADANDQFDLEMPFRFEKGHQQWTIIEKLRESYLRQTTVIVRT